MTFADATAVAPVGDGVWQGAIAPGWDIAGAANGGYLLALAARAAAAAAGLPDPVTVTGHFLAPGRPGPVRVATNTVKVGKRFTTVDSSRRTARSGTAPDASSPNPGSWRCCPGPSGPNPISRGR